MKILLHDKSDLQLNFIVKKKWNFTVHHAGKTAESPGIVIKHQIKVSYLFIFNQRGVLRLTVGCLNAFVCVCFVFL